MNGLPSRTRAVPLATTLRHARGWAALAGIESVREITGPDSLGVAVFVSERHGAAAYPYSFGKGRFALEAEVGAYMEAIETYFSEPGVAPLATKFALASALPGARGGCDPLLDFAPKLDCHADPEQPLLLACAGDVESGAQAWVPAELVFTPAPPGAGPALFGASSNGLASGNSVLEASIFALYELIERDIWSLEFIRNRAAWVDSAGLPEGAQNIAASAARNGLQLVIRYVPNDYGLAFFAAYLFDPQRPEQCFFNGGWACHPARDVALMRAVTEAAQGRAAFCAGLGDAGSTGADAQRIARQIEIVSSRALSIRFTDIPHEPAAAGLPAQWEAALRCLRRVINRPVYRAVYTPPAGPLHVVRLIVPLLEYFTPSTKRMGPRMRAELEGLAGKRG